MTDIEDKNEVLRHYGVLGMHWGKRKTEPTPLHPDYASRAVKLDKTNYGERGSARINRSLHEGKTIKEARSFERKVRETNRVDNSNKVWNKSLTAGIAAGLGTNLAIRGARKAAWSPRTLSALGKIFGNSSPAVKIAVSNSLVAARTVTNLANDPMVREVATAFSAFNSTALAFKINNQKAIDRTDEELRKG